MYIYMYIYIYIYIYIYVYIYMYICWAYRLFFHKLYSENDIIADRLKYAYMYSSKVSEIVFHTIQNY